MRPGRSDDDFEREIRAHIDLETDRLIEEGMPPDEARAAAHRRFGNVTAARERFYERNRLLWLDALKQDLRGAARSLRRYPVAAVVAITSLAAAIGATTVTLTVRNAVFHRPPPTYRNPNQLSRIHVARRDQPVTPFTNVPAPVYQNWKDALGPSIGAAALSRGDRDVRIADRTETMPVRAVSKELFSVLGVDPIVGATFPTASRDTSGLPPAILSYRSWHRLFDARQDVVGQTVWIEGQPHVVIGVMPERFWFGDMRPPIWTTLDPRTIAPDERLDVVIRRDPGVTAEMLELKLEPGLAEYAAGQPTDRRDWLLRAATINGTPVGHQVAIALPYVLAASVLLTLLIACANVAILMIAQWTTREHEIAIRASIGADRFRIVQALLTESVLVSAIGGAIGIALTYALRGWVVRNGAGVRFYDLSIDFWVLAQTAALALLTGIAAGVAPALYETRRLHANPLRALASSDRVRQRLRHALVVLEIAVTVALLVQTISMIDGYRRMARPQLGYATRSLVVARIETPPGVPTAGVLEAVKRLPGVAAAGASTTPVPFGGGRQERVRSGRSSVEVVAERTNVTGGFFDALGVSFRSGRTFTSAEGVSARVAVINESLARRLFGNVSPIGGRVWIAQDPHDIIGVVSDYSAHPLRPDWTEPRLFLPVQADAKEITRLHVLVRSDGDPGSIVRTLRREVQEALAGTTVSSAWTVEALLSASGREILAGTAPLFPLIAIGLLLTTAGIYGVLAFALTRRSKELAVRVAIGAGGTDLVRLVAVQSLRLAMAGAAIGIAVTFALAQVVRSSGGGGSVFDPPAHAFLTPLLIVAVVATVATWIPARRALEIDPVGLLRTP